MEHLGSDFNTTGSVMSPGELEELRRKRGECIRCGQKCFKKKLLKMIPITEHGKVLNGRCLNCNPLDPERDNDHAGTIPAVSRPATREDLARFNRSQSNLALSGGGAGMRVQARHSVIGMNNRSSSTRNMVSTHRRARGSLSNLGANQAHRLSTCNNAVQASAAAAMADAAAAAAASSTISPSGTTGCLLSQRSSESLVLRTTSAPPSLGGVSADAVPDASEESFSGARGSESNMVPPHVGRVPSRRTASQWSIDSALTEDEPIHYEDHIQRHGNAFGTDEYDEYTRLPLERRASDEELQQVLRQISARQTAEEDSHRFPFGEAAHPARGTSQRNLRSSSSADELVVVDDPSQRHGVLNRGGVVPFPSSGASGSGSAVNLGGGSAGSSGSASFRSGSSHHRETSSRSLQSIQSFGDENEKVFMNGEPPSHAHRCHRRMSTPTSPLEAHLEVTEAVHHRRLSAGSVELGSGSIPKSSSRGKLSSMGEVICRIPGSPSRTTIGLPADLNPSTSADPHTLSSSPTSIDEARMEALQLEAQFAFFEQQQRDGLELTTSSDHTADARFSMGLRPLVNGPGAGVQYSARQLLNVDEIVGAHSTPEDPVLDRIRAAGSDYVEIMNIMRDFSDSPSIQSTGMQELSNLHLTPEDSDALAQIGGILIIIRAMQAFPVDMELQINGCRAMWNASGTAGNQLGFVEGGALDIILHDMDQFLADSEVQEQAMATLANLAAVEANLIAMIEKGTVSRIVEGMNKHSENRQVQMKGCSVVTNLASHLTPLKKTIMEMGGGGAVVISMVMHPGDEDLQEKALRALRNLSANCDENKVELANIGGIDAVISAMQVHRDAAGVQEAGAWTLSNLAGNADNKVLIGDCAGIDVIIRAMWVHSDVVSVQEWCCRSLYTLSLDRHNSSMVLDVGGISAVVNAMQAHVDTPAIQEMGCAVLCNLATDEKCKMRIVDEEALDAIVLAMVLFNDEVKVQERACQVLLQLAIVENFKSMHASNIGELVKTAADKFPETCEEIGRTLLHVLEGFVSEYS